MYCIYKHTNKANGKSYVGLTMKGMRSRLRGHIAMTRSGSKFPFHCAIRKYGMRRNWESTVLAGNLTLDEASNLEEHYIRELNTLCPNGYNLHPGGYTAPSSNPDVAAVIGKKRKAFLSIKTNRDILSEQTKRHMAIPANRENIATKAKERWSNPEYKERVSIAVKRTLNSEKYKEGRQTMLTKSTRLITIGDISLSARNWDRKQQFVLGTISTRLNRGWSEQEAVMLPCSGHAVKRAGVRITGRPRKLRALMK